MEEGNAKGDSGEDLGPFGFFCIDPRYKIIEEGGCDVENREWIGDGGCDAEGGYNTRECGWDMGDCCEEDCNEEYSFYECGSTQPYSCVNPNAGGGQSHTNPSGSNIHDQVSFHDGFESNEFDRSHWKWMGGDAAWDIEEDPGTAAEGSHYAEARTAYIINDGGTSSLELSIDSFTGGTLSFQIQALIKAPFEDIVIYVDGVPTSIIMHAIPTWEMQELEIEGGFHTVQWEHRKNPMDADEKELAVATPNEGITRIDDVAFHPY